MSVRAKERVRRLLDGLPEDASMQDIEYSISVGREVEQGLEAIRQGRTLSHSEVRQRFRSRLPSERPPTHPGEMLLEEFLNPLGLSQSVFAARLNVSSTRVNQIVRGKRSVTPDTALRLARVLGMPADFWLGLQTDWDLWHAMRDKGAEAIAQLEPVARSEQPPG